MRYGGVTIYQTDWGFSALQISKNGEDPFNLAMAPLQMNGDKKLFGTFLPTGDADSANVKGMYVIYFTCTLLCAKKFQLSYNNIIIKPLIPTI